MPFPLLAVHLALTFLVLLAYASGLWMKWPERLYEKSKDVRFLWSWMPAAKLQDTPANCIWSIRVLCVIMIIATVFGAVLKIAFYRQMQ